MKQKKIVIAQFDDSYFPVVDGVAVTVDNYARHLNSMGAESFVVTNELYSEKGSFPYDIFYSKSLKNPFNKFYRASLARFDLKLRDALDKKIVNIVHIHSPFMVGHFGLRLAKKRKLATLATFHTKFYDDIKAAVHFTFLAKIVLKYVVNLFNKCDYVITVSEYAKKTLYDYGYKGDIIVIPNGCDLKKPINSHLVIKEIRAEYHIKDDEDLLLYVGQHKYEKNIKLIFEALKIYKKQKNNFKLLMVGSGEHAKELRVYGESLGLRDNIIYAGKILDRDKIAKIYCAADLFVFPSMYDTFALVVREAAACETPSVVVKETGPAEGIIHNVNGFISENDAEDLALKISDALCDKKKLNEIGLEALKTLPIPWEKIVDEVYELYQEILIRNQKDNNRSRGNT